MEQVHMTQQIIICIRLARNSGLGVAPIEFGCESDQLLGSGLVELVMLLLAYFKCHSGGKGNFVVCG